MQTRLNGLRRIARVYVAVSHAQAQALEQAAAEVRRAEALIEQRRSQAMQSDAAAREALQAGEHVAWQMHESQKHFMEWNAEELEQLRQQRETVLLQASEVYRSGRMQLEQIEGVLRSVRSVAQVEREHREQREADDRFLSQQWWRDRTGLRPDATFDDV